MSDTAQPVVFITGAASGIGKAAARIFSDGGMAVVVADRAETGGEVADALTALGRESLFCQVDVSSPESVAAAMASVVERFGRLDVLYNNAGGSTSKDGPILDVDDDEFWRAIG